MCGKKLDKKVREEVALTNSSTFKSFQPKVQYIMLMLIVLCISGLFRKIRPLFRIPQTGG